jgi:hypothetical protein
MKECTNLDQEIYDEAQRLFLKHWQSGRPVRLLGVGVTNLDKPHRQLALWDDQSNKKEELTKAVDDLRERFGKDIIRHADTLKPKKP